MFSTLEKVFIDNLTREMIPAMGCTEPIALAYAAAKAREYLGRKPERIVAECSGNIIKNVRCVQIPHSGGLHGIEVAVALGALAGQAERDMEVLEGVTPQMASEAADFAGHNCEVKFLHSQIPLHFIITEYCGDEYVRVETRESHTNIVYIEKNGEELFKASDSDEHCEAEAQAEEFYSLESIKSFADNVELDKVRDLIEREITCNMAIAEEGMTGKYGLGIGKAILETGDGTVIVRMKAYSAAASEARMDGCDMPVVINSGSGNQGIASSVPVIVYAREKKYDEERLYRALIFSALLTIYQKHYIGKLSAFCGAVSASCSAGAAISYLVGGTTKQIEGTISNTLANIPGIICDGAKVSCAAKIASSIDASMMAHHLAMQGKVYAESSGILKEAVDETISTVGHIGKVGMRQTDEEIIREMLK